MSPAPAPSPRLLHRKHRPNHGDAEVLLAPLRTLHVDVAKPAGSLVELPAGTSRLSLEGDTTGPVRLPFLGALVTINEPGDYRFDTSQRRLSVLAGTAAVSMGAAHVRVPAGHSLSLNGPPTLEELKQHRLIF